MVKEFTLGKMAELIGDNGLIIKCRERVNFLG